MRKNKGKKYAFGVMAAWCLAVGAAALTGCGTKEVHNKITVESSVEETAAEAIEIETEAPQTEAPETEAPDPDEQEPRVEKDGRIRSYLTGEMVPVSQGNRRPLAIMMSNDKAALPQYGINRAGVVYEVPVEATMNRYLAIMEDYDDLSRIGSVRSCRTYYVYFAREFDAIYAHYGQSTFAKPYLKFIDNINGIEGQGSTAYFRSRDKKTPHNAYASFAGIQRAIQKLGYSQEYNADYDGHFKFAKEGTQAVMHGNEGQIAVKNLIIQYCPAAYYASTEYRNINVQADTWGYYISNGQAEDITCEKDGEFGVTHYYDASGNEIVLNPGKTWICICTTNDMQPAKIEGK